MIRYCSSSIVALAQRDCGNSQGTYIHLYIFDNTLLISHSHKSLHAKTKRWGFLSELPVSAQGVDSSWMMQPAGTASNPE